MPGRRQEQSRLLLRVCERLLGRVHRSVQGLRIQTVLRLQAQALLRLVHLPERDEVLQLHEPAGLSQGAGTHTRAYPWNSR